MLTRHIPTKPDLEYLRNEAKSLLRDLRVMDTDAMAAFTEFHPRSVGVTDAKLSDAQLVVARRYRFISWPRMVVSVRLLEAIHADNADAARDIIAKHPSLIHAHLHGEPSNWGPPMSCAATLGRTRLVELFAELGAQDSQHALGRAPLHGHGDTIDSLLRLGAEFEPDAIMGPCESLNPKGLQLLLDAGCPIQDGKGDAHAPMALVLETYARNPSGKHECIAILETHGDPLPDTPASSFHRGRIDQLEEWLRHDASLIQHRFSYDEIYPPEFRNSHDTGLHGTPLEGTTLLHMAIDFAEKDIFNWLLDNGADVNASALVDGDGFGGHTPLFSCVVTQTAIAHGGGGMVEELLRRGADPTVRASIRKGFKYIEDESVHEYHDVTALEYARQFHEPWWVDDTAVEAISVWLQKTQT
jgi:hypothetical protein